MDFTDWMLALHLLSAFAVAAALVLFSVLVFSGRRMTTLEETRTLFRVAPTGNALITAGLGLVLLFGVILALDSDAFEHLGRLGHRGDRPLIAFGGVGQRARRVLHGRPEARRGARAAATRPRCSRACARPRARRSISRAVALFVLILLDMIFKPGA